MNKTAIKNFAVSARVMLINAVTQRAFEYDVTERGKNDPTQESVNGKTLSAAEKSRRSQLITNININGFAQTMEEAAYTWFNRFIALRFMEVNNYLPSHTRVFSDVEGNFKPEVLTGAVDLEIDGLDKDFVLELLETQENERLYQYILITQCNALHDSLPEIFEKIGGWTELLFPRNLLREDSIISKMVEEIPEEDWTEQVQIIGWLYQYYNTEPKEKVFADQKKNIKISSAAIPAATQLFTPDWIVRYMVENSLGRLWTEGHGKPEGAEWKYYLNEAEQEESVKADLEKIRSEYKNIQPEQIKFLDPCMGSGHILVYAFDVLMDIYTSCGWSERDAAKAIIHNNLYGLDIDRRAYQLAYFSVMMKARQYNRRIFSHENQPNLANFADVTSADTSMLSGSIKQFAEQFRYADTYGSLMTINAPDDIEKTVSEYIPTFGLSGQQLDMMMKIHRILSRKYDVVCTNPPYMGGSGMNKDLSDFVKKYYPDSKNDLFACFIEKGTELTEKGGYNCMVTMQSWMFLSGFENMRKKLIMNNTISNLMHMENMVMGIAFGTAVTSLRKGYIKGYKGTYNHIRLEDIENGLPKEFPVGGNRFAQVSAENFSQIPGTPVAYWIRKNVANIFAEKAFSSFGDIRSGMQTGNNDLFLRFWFEVDHKTIEFGISSIDETETMRGKWIPQPKGGAYRKWYGNLEYVVNFEHNGRDLRNYTGTSIIKNPQYYFRKGLSWSHTTSKSFSGRYMPEGCIFNVEAPSFYPFDESYLYYFVAFVNTKVLDLCFSLISQTMHYMAGDMSKIPIVFREDKLQIVNKLAEKNICLSKKDWDSFETSWNFEKHPLV